MPDIVSQLAELIVKDNAILFVGADLGSSQDSSPLVNQIADALALRIDYAKPDRSLAAIARDFQAMQGRNALILALREELVKVQGQPNPIHQLIADAVLPSTKVITTRFDRILEQAFDQFRKPYVLIVRDTDVSFFDESKLTLIKIQGDIDQPDSLVITADDVDDFINNLPTLSDVVRAFFATKTLIFLGYDLESDQFKRLFRQVTRNLSIYRRTAYAVLPGAVDEADRRYWASQSVEILAQDPLNFLEKLAVTVKEVVQRPVAAESNPLQKLAPTSLPPLPYKGLESFTVADAPIFFGRDLEVRRFTNRVLANRLTILYGESGSGKSSLLQAGLAPALLTQRALVAVARPDAATPLVEALSASLRRVADKAGIALTPGADLAQSLRDTQYVLDAPVVLAIDQAEQFFQVYDETAQATAVALLRTLLTDRSLDLRIVLVIREDFLGRLQPLEQLLPTLLDVRFRLDILGQEAAREAIEEPARLFGVAWEPALMGRLLQDLYDSDRRGISPPQLQINAKRLYEAATQNREGAKPAITLALFASLGNTPAILGDFLNQSIAQLPPIRQAAARNLLGSLVASNGTKQRLPLADLARAARLDTTETATVLDALVERSLVRQIVQPASISYELTHDALITHIIAWLGNDFWAAQKAREILRQAVPEWTARFRLLPAQDLEFTTHYADRLQVSAEEGQLLYTSAVARDQGVDIWYPLLAEDTRRTLLLRLARHPESEARAHAVTRLARFADAEVGDLLGQTILTDPELSVRASATLALAEMLEGAGAGAIPALVQAVGGGGISAEIALVALTTLRDLAPAVHDLLPGGLAQTLLRRVWQMRWRRGREWAVLRIVQGLQGGFWGFGAGIGLFLGLNRLIADGFSLSLLGQRFESILFGVSSGIPVMGVIGAAATAVTAAAGAILTSLEDRRNPRRTWVVQTGAGTLALALLWLLFAFVFPGETVAWRSLATGGLIGLGLFGVATAPLPVAGAVRLGLGALVGAVILYLAYAFGLIFVGVVWWVVWMGAISGLGVAWGLPPIKQGRLTRGEE